MFYYHYFLFTFVSYPVKHPLWLAEQVRNSFTRHIIGQCIAHSIGHVNKSDPKWHQGLRIIYKTKKKKTTTTTTTPPPPPPMTTTMSAAVESGVGRRRRHHLFRLSSDERKESFMSNKGTIFFSQDWLGPRRSHDPQWTNRPTETKRVKHRQTTRQTNRQTEETKAFLEKSEMETEKLRLWNYIPQLLTVTLQTLRPAWQGKAKELDGETEEKKRWRDCWGTTLRYTRHCLLEG